MNISLQKLTELGVAHYRSKRLIRSLGKLKTGKDCYLRKSKGMHASKKQVQEKKYNIETAHPAKQPNCRTQRSAEKQIEDDMRSRPKLLLNQKTDFIHTFQPMEGCQSCLDFLASLLTLIEIIL